MRTREDVELLLSGKGKNACLPQILERRLQAPATIRRGTDLARWSRRGFLLAILMLGAGVFLWGTAYKMSLYESSPIHDKVPVAKILTQAVTANKDKVASVTMPRNLTALSLLLDLAMLLLALNPQLRGSAAELIQKPLRQSPLYFSPANYLRPPPSLLLG